MNKSKWLKYVNCRRYRYVPRHEPFGQVGSAQVGPAPSYEALKLTPGKYVACDIGTSII